MKRLSASLEEPLRGALVFAMLAGALYAASLWFGPLVLGRSAQSTQVHYAFLADAFLHARLDVNPTEAPELIELIPHNGRYYVAYPPMPAVILMPLVAAFGVTFPPALASIMLAALCVGLVFLLLRRLDFDGNIAAAAAILFGFGTAFWYAALKGSSWNLAHVTASFFLLLALAEASGRRRPLLVGLAVGAAGLARLPIFLAAPVLAAWLLAGESRKPARLSAFILGLGVFVVANLAYNWARFEGPLAASYLLIPGILDEPWFSKGFLHPMYLPRNVYRLVFQPPALSESFPFVVPSSYGTSLLFTTPAFLLCFFAPANRRTLLFSCAALLVAIPSLFHGHGGWTQYGYRYSLDYTPFLIVLAAAGIQRFASWRPAGRLPLPPLVFALVGLSVFASLWGLAFIRAIPPADFFPFAEEIGKAMAQ